MLRNIYQQRTGGILSAAVDDVIGSTFWENVKDFKEVLF